ncbi:MAG: signal recognition particle-docking protein FtsY [Immundisolibacterales bacterium]|nr:signal recognition particle-docking protein FtsY [Immundisolibacterales bacterium]
MPTDDERPATPSRTGILGRLRTALKRTRENLSSGLADLFSRGRKIDAALIDEVEEVLLGADVGVDLTDIIVADLRERLKRRRLADGSAVLGALREHMVQALEPVACRCEVPPPAALERPFVVLVVGVNGVGKTTTIGKLAHRLGADGYSVMLAAGDTFRAAAIDQIKVWGERNGVPVIAQQPGADSAAVVFDALQAATARSANVLIADTAGRLHTKTGLMDELAKVRRVLGRLDPAAPHETLLVLDATTGQNGLAQARRFTEAVRVSGLAVTKLDGTARGGVLFAIARELAIPIRYIGVGEGIDDLRDFVPEDFVDALLARAPGEG